MTKKRTDGGHEIPEEDLRERIRQASKCRTEWRAKRDIAAFAARPEWFIH